MKLVFNFKGDAIPMWVQLLFWLLYLVVFVYAIKKTAISWDKDKRYRNVSWVFAIFFVLYAIFYCINDDYFSYRDWIYGRNFNFWGKEQFYAYIILFCRSLHFDYPYELFRLIVWGGAVFLSYQTYRLYRRLPGLALLLLFVFFAGTFCYARASLAMAVYFFGVALFLRRREKYLKTLGIAIALSSYLFHHEMIICIALLPCLFIPFEKKEFSYITLFLLLGAIVAVSFASSNLKFFDQMMDNDITSKIEQMNQKGQGVLRLSTLIKYLNFFFPFCLITLALWKRKRLPRSIAGMYRITCGILVMSVAFMAVFGLRDVYAYRIMYISMIPMVLLITYGYRRRLIPKGQLLIMLAIALLSNSIRFINS